MADSYSRGNYTTLPTTAADLETAYFVPTDYDNVHSINSVFVIQEAVNEYAIHQFKKDVGNVASGNWTFTGKSSFDCATNIAKLEVWNVTGAVWETALDTDNTTAAGSPITLTTGDISTTDRLSSGVIVFRVYQGALASLWFPAGWFPPEYYP